MFASMIYIDTSGVTVDKQNLKVLIGLNDGALAIENKLIAATKTYVLATYGINLLDNDIISLNLRRG